MDARRARRLKRLKKRRRRWIRNTALIFLSVVFLLVVLIDFACSSCGVNKSHSAETTTAKEADASVKQPETEQEPQTQENIPSHSVEFTEVEAPEYSDSYKEINDDKILSPYIVLLDVDNNEIIAGKHPEKKIYPASMTKVMTLIVAVEQLESLDDTFEMTNEIIGPLWEQQASMAGFAGGEKVCAKDLLYGIILPSGADACVGLATMVAGSEENFVKLMNQKCEEIGLKQTHFMNASGLYDEKHYTTPVEMAMIMEYAMSNEVCREVLSTYEYTTAKTEQHPEGILLTSTMFSRMYGTEVDTVTINAGKTGYTDEAGSCLVSYATRGDDHYVAVTAKAMGKWNCIFDDFYLYGNYIPNPPGYVRS